MNPKTWSYDTRKDVHTSDNYPSSEHILFISSKISYITCTLSVPLTFTIENYFSSEEKNAIENHHFSMYSL